MVIFHSYVSLPEGTLGVMGVMGVMGDGLQDLKLESFDFSIDWNGTNIQHQK